MDRAASWSRTRELSRIQIDERALATSAIGNAASPVGPLELALLTPPNVQDRNRPIGVNYFKENTERTLKDDSCRSGARLTESMRIILKGCVDRVS